MTISHHATGGTFQLTYDGVNTDLIPWNANAMEVQSALTMLRILDQGDVRVTQASATAPWVVTFIGKEAGIDQPDISATDYDLTGDGHAVSAAVTTQGAALLNLLDGVERAELQGTIGNDLLDAHLFGGLGVILRGGPGDDVIMGSGGADTLTGGSGNDRISGDAGADSMDGGAGVDALVESRDASFTLTNTTLTSGGEIDTIANFEVAELTGGASANTIDCSGFSGLTDDTSLGTFNAETDHPGLGTYDGVRLNLTGITATTPISLLNNGVGIRLVAGTDFNIVLRDGTVGRSTSARSAPTATLDELFAAHPLPIAADRHRHGRRQRHSPEADRHVTPGTGDLAITAYGTSPTAADLGLLGAGSGDTLVGTADLGRRQRRGRDPDRRQQGLRRPEPPLHPRRRLRGLRGREPAPERLPEHRPDRDRRDRPGRQRRHALGRRVERLYRRRRARDHRHRALDQPDDPHRHRRSPSPRPSSTAARGTTTSIGSPGNDRITGGLGLDCSTAAAASTPWSSSATRTSSSAPIRSPSAASSSTRCGSIERAEISGGPGTTRSTSACSTDR